MFSSGLLLTLILSIVYIILLQWFVKTVIYSILIIVTIVTAQVLIEKITQCHLQICDEKVTTCDNQTCDYTTMLIVGFLLACFLMFNFMFREEVKNSCKTVCTACR